MSILKLTKNFLQKLKKKKLNYFVDMTKKDSVYALNNQFI